MKVTLTQLIGYFGTVVSAASLVPQVVRTWRTRSAQDIAVGWLVMGFLGALAWVIYGWLLPAFEVFIANALIAGMLGVLLAMRFLFYRDFGP